MVRILERVFSFSRRVSDSRGRNVRTRVPREISTMFDVVRQCWSSSRYQNVRLSMSRRSHGVARPDDGPVAREGEG